MARTARTQIVLSCFYLFIFYFEKFSTWICRLPFAVYVKLKRPFCRIALSLYGFCQGLLGQCISIRWRIRDERLGPRYPKRIGRALIFPLFLVFSADSGILCSGSFSHHVKFYSFTFMQENSTWVVCVNCKHYMYSFVSRTLKVWKLPQWSLLNLRFQWFIFPHSGARNQATGAVNIVCCLVHVYGHNLCGLKP